MGLELLETEGDTFLLVVEVEDNHVELLVEADNFFGVVYAAPRKVCDVYETVDTTQVDEYTVGSDVFNGSLKHLAFFEFGDDFAFLLLEFGFDESFVADNHVFEFGVDFNNLEFHGLANEDIIVADGFDVDLRSGEESLYTEHIDNHAAFCAAFDESFDDFVVFQSLVYALPRARCAGFAVREDELAFLILLVFDEHLDNVADFDVGVVAEFVHRDDAVRLVADVNHSFAFVERDDGTFDYIFVFNGVERFIVGFGEFLTRFVALVFAFFIGIPIEIGDWRVFNFFSH